MYSIRHTYATEQYKKGTSIEDISILMNTSPRMVMSVYLGNTDEALVQLHKRIPKKLKVVKWPIFWIPFEFLLNLTLFVMNSDEQF